MKRIILLTLLFVQFSIIGHAQQQLSEYSQKNFEKAMALYKSKKYADAKTEFTKVISSSQNHAKSYYFRGIAIVKCPKQI